MIFQFHSIAKLNEVNKTDPVGRGDSTNNRILWADMGWFPIRPNFTLSLLLRAAGRNFCDPLIAQFGNSAASPILAVIPVQGPSLYILLFTWRLSNEWTGKGAKLKIRTIVIDLFSNETDPGRNPSTESNEIKIRGERSRRRAFARTIIAKVLEGEFQSILFLRSMTELAQEATSLFNYPQLAKY